MPDNIDISQKKEKAPEILVDLAERIEVTENIEELRATVKDFVQVFETRMNVQLSSDVTSLYGQMSCEQLLARVESISGAMGCLVGGRPISVGGGDAHYANSVTADPEGLRIAMAEAEAPGPIRMLVGLDMKALVGFNKGHISVKEIGDNEFDLRDTALRKAYCRHVSGEIRAEDIRYIVLRIPRGIFPKEQLKPEEEKTGSRFIFRGGRIAVAADSVSQMAA